jgi:protein RecA
MARVASKVKTTKKTVKKATEKKSTVKKLTVAPSEEQPEVEQKKVTGKIKGLDTGSMFRLDVKLVETGIIPLDIVLGGGIPRGDMIEISSTSGVGKTTLTLAIVKEYLNQGLRCAYFDVERGVKRPILENFKIMDKVSPDIGSEFLLLSPETYDDLEQLFDAVVIKDPYDLVIVDSITSVLPAKVKDKSVSEAEIGLEARQMTAFLKKYKPELRSGGTSIILINQMRMFISTSRFIKSELVSAGGQSLQFMPDIRIRMEVGKKLTRDEKTPFGTTEVVFGNQARMYTIKNRNERSGIKVDIPIIFGRGISNVMVVEDICKNADILTGGAGGIFRMCMNGGEPVVLKGLGEVRRYIRENYEDITALLKRKGLLAITQGVEE